MLRVSVDTKATVPVGEYSRDGQSRCLKPVAALDHDMHPMEKLTPGGILEAVSGQAFLFFTDSRKTSDFIVDGLHAWWQSRRRKYNRVKQLVINMDNGPECSGRRSQFLYRMTEFADRTGLSVRLVYYPPYHSKYNAIERYWAGLEKSWNGYLLNTVSVVLQRAGNFCWKGMKSIVRLFDVVYEKGVTVSGEDRAQLEERLHRDPDLPFWDITIYPKAVF
ncbi:MAG: Rhodopirellula transposase family protein [Candidatus Brocadiaceae bacterium]|nr:Rhodopirellula transposase family protein [Candidatus Brocadiaceae bacterium]